MREALEAALEALTNPSTIMVQHAIYLLDEKLSKCQRCGKKLGDESHIHTCSPIYKMQREWVGLTDDEQIAIASTPNKSRHWFVWETESKLRSKNG
jgi:hypothetical protein